MAGLPAHARQREPGGYYSRADAAWSGRVDPADDYVERLNDEALAREAWDVFFEAPRGRSGPATGRRAGSERDQRQKRTFAARETATRYRYSRRPGP